MMNNELNRFKIDWATFFFVLVLLAMPSIALAPPKDAYFSVTDIPEFYSAAVLMLKGQAAQIYQVEAMKQIQLQLFPELATRWIPLYVPPFAVPLLAPLALLPTSIVCPVWQGLLVLFLAIALLLIGATYLFSKRQFMLLAVLATVSGPAWESIRIGQLAPLLLLSFVSTITLLKSKKNALAAAAAVFFLLKPHEFAPFMCFLLGALKLEFIGFFAGLSLAMVGLSFLVFGQAGYAAFFNLLSYSMKNMEWMAPQATPTLRGQLLRFSQLDASQITQATGLVYLLILVLLVFVGYKSKTNKQWLELAVALSVPVGLLTSLHCFAYDFLLLLPALAAFSKIETVQALSKRTKIFVWTLISISGGCFILPQYSFIHYGYVLHGAQFNPLFFALLILTLTTSLTILFSRQKRQ